MLSNTNITRFTSALPISRDHFSPNFLRKKPLAHPIVQGMGVFHEFEVWQSFTFEVVVLCERSCCIVPRYIGHQHDAKSSVTSVSIHTMYEVTIVVQWFRLLKQDDVITRKTLSALLDMYEENPGAFLKRRPVGVFLVVRINELLNREYCCR